MTQPTTPPSPVIADADTGKASVSDSIAATLARIERHNPALNCFSAVLHERALSRAERLDAELARGRAPGPLLGLPFAVKNLFDIEGLATLAGSRINADRTAAARDAVLIRRLENAGAILVGALAMGEYAYDFTGENAHYGPCRNPFDPGCMSGGSSSGSGSAVGADLVPLSLGSDTNGSIRVPASLCGLFGLKPSYGRLPRSGSFPFCDSLDHLGPLARSVNLLAASYDAMQGHDAGDHACAPRPAEPVLPQLDAGLEGLRLARAGGYFDCAGFPEAGAAVDAVCAALGVERTLPLDGALEGRSAAYLITNAESAMFHRERLIARAMDFDPDTRDRFLAGSLVPATWYIRAQAVRRSWQQRMLEIFAEVDAIVAPCTPCTAPEIGTKLLRLGDREVPLRPNLGLFTQPFSAIGLPVCSVPVWTSANGMPIGVQIVAPPWREDLCLRIARALESEGIAACRPAPRFTD